jgi:glycosyltransferase involved in cell wall biosynthesis
MSDPKVSVIMSTYCRNRGEGACDNLLKRALDSVLGQNFKEFELILIDDGSIDGSQKVCQEYADKDERVKYVRFDENSGVPAKRYNDGMEMARGEYIAFMFDDDLWYPNALTYLYEGITVTHPECDLIYGLTNYMNVKTGEPLALNFGGEWKWEVIDKQNFICNNAVIITRDVVNKVGGYDEALLMKRLCDWDLWWRIGKDHKVKRILKVIGEVHAFHSDSIGVTVGMNFEEIKKHQLKPQRTVRLQGQLKKKL